MSEAEIGMRPDDALPPREVSRLTGLSITTLRRMRAERRGPQFWETGGGQARYRRAEVERWIRERSVQTDGR